MLFPLLLTTLAIGFPVNYNDDSRYEDSYEPALFTPSQEEFMENPQDQEFYYSQNGQENDFQDSDDLEYDLDFDQDFDENYFSRYTSFQAANALESSGRGRSDSSASVYVDTPVPNTPVPKPYQPKNKFKTPNLGPLDPSQAGKLLSAAKQAYSSTARQNSFMNRNMDAYKQGFSHADASLDPSKKAHRKAFKNAVQESEMISNVRDKNGRRLDYDLAQEARKRWVDDKAPRMAQGGRNLKKTLTEVEAKSIAYAATRNNRDHQDGGGFTGRVERSAPNPAAAPADGATAPADAPPQAFDDEEFDDLDYDFDDEEYQDDFNRYTSFQAANALESSGRGRSDSSASVYVDTPVPNTPVPKPYQPKNKFKTPNLGPLDPSQAGKLLSAAKQAYSSTARQNSFMNRNMDAYKQGFSHADASLDPRKKDHRKAFKNAVQESEKIGQVRDSRGQTLDYDIAQESRKRWVDNNASRMAQGGRNAKIKLSEADAKKIATSAGIQSRESTGGGFSSVQRSAAPVGPVADLLDDRSLFSK